MNSVGSRIKQARENAHITQEQLGKLCRTTKQTIFKYETGVVTNIPMDRIVAISSALGVDPCTIMGWDSPKCSLKPAVNLQPAELRADESDLLRKYRALDEAGRGRIRNALDYEYNSIPGSETDSVPKEA